MAGTKEGGRKAAITNKQRYGEGFYVGIGAAGGRKSTGGAFAKNRELAREAGRKGGMASRRRPYSEINAEKVEKAYKASLEQYDENA